MQPKCPLYPLPSLFYTATSMGRFTLNMLFSFSQFEREVTAERMRDNLKASNRKGLWMGKKARLDISQAGEP